MPSSYTIGKHFEAFVERQLASGRYNNASEVIREALRLMEDRERRPVSYDTTGLRYFPGEGPETRGKTGFFSESAATFDTPAPRNHEDLLRAKIQQALDDPRPAIPHVEVEARFARRRAAARAKTAKPA